MTGLENQREFGHGYFSISEQGLRHVVAAIVLITVSVLASQFISVYFLYAIIGAVAVAIVAAFLMDTHHKKLSVDDDA